MMRTAKERADAIRGHQREAWARSARAHEAAARTHQASARFFEQRGRMGLAEVHRAAADVELELAAVDQALADVTGTDGMPLGGEELKGVTEGVGGSSEGELPSYRPASPLSASLASKGLDVVLPGSDETKKGVTTRAKFICPGCADAAWGKPSLNIICGKCKTEFKRASSTQFPKGNGLVKASPA